MRDVNRGFAFVVGVALTIWLFRLFGIGWVSDLRQFISSLISGEVYVETNNGLVTTAFPLESNEYNPADVVYDRDGNILANPAQLISEALFELMIAVGSAAILSLKGLTYLLGILWSGLGVSAGTFTEALREWRTTASHAPQPPPAPASMAVEQYQRQATCEKLVNPILAFQSRQMEMSQIMFDHVRRLQEDLATMQDCVRQLKGTSPIQPSDTTAKAEGNGHAGSTQSDASSAGSVPAQ